MAPSFSLNDADSFPALAEIKSFTSRDHPPISISDSGKPMKIVLIKRPPFSLPDGISHFLFSLANELMARGHEVVGITTRDPDLDRVAERFAYPNIPPITTLTDFDGQGYYFEFMTWLKYGSAIVASYQPDLIIVNGAVPCRFTAPSVTVAHDAEKRAFEGVFWPRWIYKVLLYRNTNKLVTTCSELVSSVAEDAIYPSRQIGIIPTCITPELYHPRPLSERQQIIVHVGMHIYKNPLASIRSFLPMADRAVLYLVGSIDPEIARYVDALPECQRSKILLPGIVRDDEFKHLLETARVVSVPSQYDSPVASPTVLEAFACGTPVVVSTGISRDLIKPGFNGYMTDDDAERTRAFEELLIDDTKWQSLSQGAVETTQTFSASTVADQYLGLFSRAK